MTATGDPPPANDNRSRLLSVAEAAAHLGVAEAFVRRLVLERRVRFYKVGHYVRFRVADLNAFVEAGRRDPVEIDLHPLSAQHPRTARANMRGIASRGD